MQREGTQNLISWSTVTILDSTTLCVCLLANVEDLTVGVPDTRVINIVSIKRLGLQLANHYCNTPKDASTNDDL